MGTAPVLIGAINISEDGQGKSGREGLLYWCQKQTASYKINVTNFTSWCPLPSLPPSPPN